MCVYIHPRETGMRLGELDPLPSFILHGLQNPYVHFQFHMSLFSTKTPL